MKQPWKQFAIWHIVLVGIFLIKWVYPQTLTTQTSTLFSGSGNCAVCHAPGSPNPQALLDPQGHDISPVNLWRSTMMANAAIDPFWQAKVTAEVSAHPQFQQVIEDKCTTCHMPQGRTEAIFLGQQYYSLQTGQSDPLAMEGVSCTVCHQIKDVNLGTGASFSGHYTIENDHIIYGPYPNPVANPMINMSGYTPVHSTHVESSELCATCHTLFTPTVDNNGQIVGEMPEQTPYLEWENSIFPAQDIQCQTCHMPAIDNPVIISNRPPYLSARSPFYKHYFVGGNTFMLKILRDNSAQLGVFASTQHFDSTLARTERLLRNETADLNVAYSWQGNDTLVLKVAVHNKTGHKLPTGYPSRRLWLYVQVQDGNGTPLFTSGEWDSLTGEIVHLDSTYEPHYQVITSPEQVQIYQAVMKDVDGQVNYTLLRGAGYIKDNRIPPEGFTTTGAHYDTTTIIGAAAADPNFNRSGSTEGTGTDTVVYKIGGLNSAGSYHAEVQLLYQTLEPRFVEDLFQYNTPEVQAFQNYYQNADKSPFQIASKEVQIGGTSIAAPPAQTPNTHLLVSTYPNPFNPRITVRIETRQSGQLSVEIYDLLGKRIAVLHRGYVAAGNHRLVWDANSSRGAVASGEYLLRVNLYNSRTGTRETRIRKIVFLK